MDAQGCKLAALMQPLEVLVFPAELLYFAGSDEQGEGSQHNPDECDDFLACHSTWWLVFAEVPQKSIPA